MRILIVDDETNIRKSLRIALESMKNTVEEAVSPNDASKRLERTSFDVAFVDLRLKDESGLDLIETLTKRSPRLAVVIITAYASIDSAVDAMRRGAFDYLPKPFTPAQIRAVLERFDRMRSLQSQIADLREQIGVDVPEFSLESKDPQVRTILEQGRQVAPTDAVVLIRGESGTGKGVFARAIHTWSRRARAPFVTVSCPSLSADLLESELFGHARGSFTGAVADTEGKVAAAEGGTLFLDEIGDLPLLLQPKLLRFLQERRYERVGENRTRGSDVRLIAASNRDLDAAVASGQFRDDLLFRLNVVELTLPPLRAGGPDRPGHAPSGVLRPANWQENRRVRAAGSSGVALVCMARQPPRASQRDRTGRHLCLVTRGRPERPAGSHRRVRRGSSGRAARLDRGRLARQPGTARNRAHPALARALPQPRRRRPSPGHRSQHALSQAQATGPLIVRAVGIRARE